MTSLMGVRGALARQARDLCGDAVLRGWGLTNDLIPAPDRRKARPSLLALAYATLIAYPRYIDPITRRPCPPETAVERLATGMIPKAGPFNRITAKLQGWLSDSTHLWR